MRNEALTAASTQTGIPRETLMALAYQQGRFEPAVPHVEEGPGDPNHALDDAAPADAVDAENEGLPSAELTEADLAGDSPEAIEAPTESEMAEVGDAHVEATRTWGLMWLSDAQVARGVELTQASEEAVRTDIATNVLAAARILEQAWKQPSKEGVAPGSPEALALAIDVFLGVDDSPEAAALSRQELKDIHQVGFDLTTHDGERLVLQGITGVTTAEQQLAAGAYPPIKWIAASKHSSRDGRRIAHIVVHSLETSLQGGINTFRSSAAQGSAHYLVGTDTDNTVKVVQMVKEDRGSWHCGHGYYNDTAIAIEHAGFAAYSDGKNGNFSKAYVKSAQLACAISKKYGIPVDRKHILGHRNVPSNQGTTALCPDYPSAKYGVKGCGGKNGHYDPGIYWNWSKYMSLVAQCRSGKPIDGTAPVKPRPPPPPASHYDTLSGDFDGDGKADLATISANAKGGWANWLSVNLSSGTGFGSATWTSATPTHERNGGPNADYRELAGDFDGDGKTDIAVLSPNAAGAWKGWVTIDRSTGTGFESKQWTAATPTHMRNGGSTRRYFVLTGDFNGDGKADLATVSPDAGGGWANWVAVDRSTGTGFEQVRVASQLPTHMRNGGADNTYYFYATDLNGDGRQDFATWSPNGGGAWGANLEVEISQPDDTFTSGFWPAMLPRDVRNGGATRSYFTLIADVTGEGRPDVVTVSKDSGGGWKSFIQVEASTGTGFTSGHWVNDTPTHMRNGM